MNEEEKVFNDLPGEEYIDDRNRFTVFFQVLGRKFWKLMSVNLMYGFFNLPAILVSLFISSVMIMPYITSTLDAALQNDPFTFMLIGTFPLIMFLMAVPVITVGPAQAGLTYLLRCFANELPTFDWSDFKDKMKENLKQGFVVSLINLLLTVFLMVDFYLYSQLKSNSNLIPVANGLLIVVFLLFLMMNLYIYPMMVTYKLRVKDLYKNALLFSFAKFLPNLAILIICSLLIVAPMLIVNFTGSVLALIVIYIYYALLGFSLPGLIINFMVNPVIDKYMNPANSDKQEDENEIKN